MGCGASKKKTVAPADPRSAKATVKFKVDVPKGLTAQELTIHLLDALAAKQERGLHHCLSLTSPRGPADAPIGTRTSNKTRCMTMILSGRASALLGTHNRRHHGCVSQNWTICHTSLRTVVLRDDGASSAAPTKSWTVEHKITVNGARGCSARKRGL